MKYIYIYSLISFLIVVKLPFLFMYLLTLLKYYDFHFMKNKIKVLPNFKFKNNYI